MTPETRFARAAGLYLAYQTLGEGAVDLVLAEQWTSHQEAQWDVPPVAELRRRVAAIGRLILFDKRGVGMSDPVPIESLSSTGERRLALRRWRSSPGGHPRGMRRTARHPSSHLLESTVPA